MSTLKSKSINIDLSTIVTDANKEDMIDMCISHLETTNKLLKKAQTFNNLIMKECKNTSSDRILRIADKSSRVFKQLTTRISFITKKIAFLYDDGQGMSVEEIQALVNDLDSFSDFD